MKKRLMILAACLVLLLFSCADNAPVQTQTQAQTQTEAPLTVEEFRAATQSTAKATTTQTNLAAQTEQKEQIVYITPTGKRYHLSPTCGGKNSYPVTISEAIKQGYTPCKKCAGG